MIILLKFAMINIRYYLHKITLKTSGVRKIFPSTLMTYSEIMIISKHDYKFYKFVDIT